MDMIALQNCTNYFTEKINTVKRHKNNEEYDCIMLASDFYFYFCFYMIMIMLTHSPGSGYY